MYFTIKKKTIIKNYIIFLISSRIVGLTGKDESEIMSSTKQFMYTEKMP